MMQQIIQNRYKIIRDLGDGGFGKTFLAEDTYMPSGRWCVIKQLKPIDNDPQVYQMVKKRFGREAAILEELGNGSKQIPQLYAYFESGGLFYLVQEWIEGETLTRKTKQQGKISEATVKNILLNLLPVLEYVHSKKIVHRDIKPDNVILRFKDELPVLIDFGAVKETMGTTMTTSGDSTSSIVIGTPGFMPSEQGVGRPVFASDLYALGLSAIYLLTAKIPQEFEIDRMTGAFLWRKYALSVSPSFAAILDKATQFHPRDRYSTAREMLEALRSNIISTKPTEVYNPTVTSPHPAAGVSYQQPTVTSPHPAAGVSYQQPTVISPHPSAGVSYQPNGVSSQPITNTPSSSGLKDWQKAIIIGSVIGGLILAAIWFTRQPQVKPQPQQPNPTPTRTDTSGQNQQQQTETPIDSTPVTPSDSSSESTQTETPINTTPITPSDSSSESTPKTTPTTSTSSSIDFSNPEKALDDLADRIFYDRHPELRGRKIKADEKALAQEWSQIRQCDAVVDYVFYQRHPELEGRKILTGEKDLSEEWLQIKSTVGGCK